MDWVVLFIAIHLTTNQLSCYTSHLTRLYILSLLILITKLATLMCSYCKGGEERLEDCEVGKLKSHSCSYLGIARCLDGK